MYQQQYRQYSIQQQQTWNILFTKRVEGLSQVVAQPFWAGLHALELKAYFIPDFQELNLRLRRFSDWQLEAVERELRPAQVLSRWSRMKFPALTSLRLHPDSDLRMQGNRDLFTDVFSLLPWLHEPAIADFMHRLGLLSRQYKSAEAIEMLWRLAQHVLGKGLLRSEAGEVTLLGACLLANAPEAQAALANAKAWKPAVLEDMLSQPYTAQNAADGFFVLESLSDLDALVRQLEKEGLPIIEAPGLTQLIA